MAVRASIGTGNFTTAGTWGLVDSTSYLNAETAAEVLTTAYSGTRSQAFTPGAITVSHLGVKLNVRTGTTGTISVELAQAGTPVAGTEVTINVADLPAAVAADLNGGWIFFKLSSPVTLLGATAYTIEAKTSSATQVSLWRGTATADDLCRALITTTTGAPGAGDDLIVAGEYVSAGSSNTFTVTMDSTASTDYGSASTSVVTPSLSICSKGVLSYGTTSATNYILRQSGNIVVYAGGTFNIGTTGTPIPRDSTALLEFDCAADGDFGLVVRNLGTCNMQGLSRTSGKDIVSCKLNTDEAANSTSLGVDTDTGWLDNDVIAVAPTTQTATQGEAGTLNGAAGASSLTVDGFGGGGGGLLNAHAGTSPTQAEVILLTRNVKVWSVSSTAMAYINAKPTATIDWDWIEFRYMGENVATKRGIEVETTTGSFNMQYCSMRDFEDHGFFSPFSTANNIVFSNNVGFNLNSAGGGSANAVTIAATSGTSITLDNNVFIGAVTNSGAIFSIGDAGIIFTNNSASGSSGGANSNGINITEGPADATGTFSNNTVHSCAGRGFALGGLTNVLRNATFTNFTVWRCGNSGVTIQALHNCIFDSLVAFGTAFNVICTSTGARGTDVTFISPVISGDTSFASQSGIGFNTVSANGIYTMRVINGDFGTVTGIKTAHTSADIRLFDANYVQMVLINTKLASSTEVTGMSNLEGLNSYIASQKNDQTTGSHKMWKKYGNIEIETTTVHTGSQSMKLTPTGGSGNKLQTQSFFVAVASGATVTPTVYVYEDGSYNGNRARLILKRNDAIGITSDTVIDTATAASDAAWEGLTGTTAAATDDGVMEFIVDCDGSAGNLFVDSFTAA